MGDIIVVTTTDYVPNHSEELQICYVIGNTILFTRDLTPGACRNNQYPGVQWTHNGQQYPLDRLPPRLNIKKKAAETRAAVALLTRSIRIVSAGDDIDSPFPVCTRIPAQEILFRRPCDRAARVCGIPSPGS